MMQIFIDAIEKSRVDEPQYVLSKSLEYASSGNIKKVLSLLREGYTLHGKFVNGTGEYSYKVAGKQNVEVLYRFITSELVEFNVTNGIDTICISFQEFFEGIGCEGVELRGWVDFWRNGDKKPADSFMLSSEKSVRLKEFLDFVLNIK